MLEVRRDTLSSLTDDLCAYYESLDFIEANIQQLVSETKDDVDGALSAITDLHLQRDQCIEEIKQFSTSLVRKTDNCADVIRRIDSEVVLCQQEEQRLFLRRKRFLSAQKDLKDYIVSVMLENEVKQLKTPTNTITVQRNGGLQKITVLNESQIENCLCNYEGTLDASVYQLLYQVSDDPHVRTALNAFRRQPDMPAIRKELAVVCSNCGGDGVITDGAEEAHCPKCNGVGNAQVSGVKLEPRGHHIRLT